MNDEEKLLLNNENLKGQDRYELKEKLATTLQGKINRAVDRTTGKIVVCKQAYKICVSSKKSSEQHNIAEDFLEEKNVMKYLSGQKDCHRGFVRLLDEWEENDSYFYVMDSCEEELLSFILKTHTSPEMKSFTKNQETLPPQPMNYVNKWTRIVRHIFRQLVDAVSWMNKKSVCHRDLSMENTMISDSQTLTIKIIDFGVALHSKNGSFIDDKRVGKSRYMAPEVYEKIPYDARSADIWSLGIMLFIMLVGSPPYEFPSLNNAGCSYLLHGKLKQLLIAYKRLGHVTVDALDLLTKIFKLEKDRISMEDIRKHPFVQLDPESSDMVDNDDNKQQEYNNNNNYMEATVNN